MTATSQDDDNTNMPDQDHIQQSFIVMSDDEGLVCAPPAHLTERLYRKSLSRRKSSATSSRRNSMTSSHSHHSHGSSCMLRHRTTQSTHVAQHLRRASILESRKARLADRAAHAEQVRMRAVLAKAVPKASITSSEEKAHAAQLAREKYLAKVVAACAEEVQRAKQKAHESKLRKLQEERRVRQDMEDRFAEADKRRAEYQRNLHARRQRRASSVERKLAVVTEDPDVDTELAQIKEHQPEIDDETAALRIQRSWLLRRRRTVVYAFLELDLSADSLKTKSFEEVGMLLASAKVLHATASMFHLCKLARAADTRAASTRTFLSAFLIVAHPTAVFDRQGEQEHDLLHKARELVTTFGSVISRLALWNRYTISPTHTEELTQADTTYAAAFEAWKAKDASALIDAMVASFVELDAMWQTVKDDSNGHVAADYRQGIRDNQIMLLSKIRKLAGPERASLLIKRTIRENRRNRARAQPTAEIRPRAAAAQSIETSQTTELPALPTNSAIDGQTRFRASFTPIPSNRQLTHELAINKDFRIEALRGPGDKDALNRALCEQMQAGIEAGEGALWTTAMAECIRGKLLVILKPEHALYALVTNVLDSDHIYDQCSRGVFEYSRFFEFMASVLPKICAPFRDAQVAEIIAVLQDQSNVSTSSMIEKLFGLLHTIDLLSLDYSNFLLMSAAPTLIQESAGYEQRSFEKDLQSGAITLSNTMSWWARSRSDLVAQAAARNPEGVQITSDVPIASAIYNRALCELGLTQNQAVAQWPETLTLDQTRLLGIRREVMHMTCIGATLLTAKNLLKRDVRSAWKSEAQRLWDVLANAQVVNGNSVEAVEDVAQQAYNVVSSAHNLPPATQTMLRSAIGRFFAQTLAATRSASPDGAGANAGHSNSARLSDPVMKLLFQRLKQHIITRVSASSTQDRVRAISTASETLAGAGLAEFVTRVGSVVDLLIRVREVDWAAHGRWYEEIAVGQSAT